MTSLVAKKDAILATRIEEAIRKNESLESLTADNVRRDIARDRITEQKTKTAKLVRVSSEKSKAKSSSAAATTKSSSIRSQGSSGKAPSPAKSQKSAVRVSKSVDSSRNNPRKPSSGSKKPMASSRRRPGIAIKSTGPKLNVVGFRGRSNQSDKRRSVSS